jgi:putative transcriptional regulator
MGEWGEWIEWAGPPAGHATLEAYNLMKPSLKGQLILDDGRLRGSFFHRTVILICEHNDEGAFGLVLNRASENKVGDALVANVGESIKQLPLFIGGPVQTQMMTILHSDVLGLQANVMPNLRMDQSLDVLQELGESYSPSRQLKLFAGYAGWSPGQLEAEMKRDTWLTHPATLEHVFCARPAELWKTVLAEKGWKYRLMADSPEDISWN